MSSIRAADQTTLISQLMNESAQNGLKPIKTKFYAEDGWLFREHPGKRVECLCRYGDDANAALAKLGLARMQLSPGD